MRLAYKLNFLDKDDTVKCMNFYSDSSNNINVYDLQKMIDAIKKFTKQDRIILLDIEEIYEC